MARYILSQFIRSVHVILLLGICFILLGLWKYYDHQKDSETALLDSLSHLKLDENDQALWSRYLGILSNAEPSWSALRINWVWRRRFHEIQNIDDTTLRIDAAHLSETSLNESTAAHAMVVSAIPEYLAIVCYRNHTRGIVTVGGGDFMGPALISIRMLRRTNSHLPVEVFLPSQEDYDSYICDEILRDLNARCIVLPKLGNFKIKRYQYKALAILASSFEDILLLDADSFPIIKPDELFDSAPYNTTGLVTWPDFWASSTSPLYYQISAQTPPALTLHASTESGQMLISKRKHAGTILLTMYYNLYGPKFYYRLLSQGAPGEGDKDTFVAAAMALNSSYYQVRERVATIGYIDGHGYYHGAAMCQRHPGEDYALYLLNKTVGHRNSKNAQIAFIHQSGIKLNPHRLLAYLYSGYRMWGPESRTVERFGYDLEAGLWKEILEVACGGRRNRKEWKRERKTCDRLTRFWDDIGNKEGRPEL